MEVSVVLDFAEAIAHLVLADSSFVVPDFAVDPGFVEAIVLDFVLDFAEAIVHPVLVADSSFVVVPGFAVDPGFVEAIVHLAHLAPADSSFAVPGFAVVLVVLADSSFVAHYYLVQVHDMKII